MDNYKLEIEYVWMRRPIMERDMDHCWKLIPYVPSEFWFILKLSRLRLKYPRIEFPMLFSPSITSVFLFSLI